jgi:hypothetical protein
MPTDRMGLGSVGTTAGTHVVPGYRCVAAVASTLVLSESTVKTHVSHVLAKIGARDRIQAVIFAYDTGLAQPSSD